MPPCSLSDSHDVANRICKSLASLEALRETVFGAIHEPFHAKTARQAQKGVLNPLRNWQNRCLV